MSLTMTEMLRQLQLPEPEAASGFANRFEESVTGFSGLPEYMTMEFVHRYYPWVGGDEKHYTAFERVAEKVAASEALQLYAHHAHNVLFVYPLEECRFGSWPVLSTVLGDDSGMFDFMIAMSAIPMWAETHRKMGIPENYSRASAEWLNGTLRIYNSAHPGCYGIDRTQVYWLRFNIDGKLFRIGRFEYMIEELPGYMPRVFRNKTTGKTIALCGDNWGLLGDGTRMFNKGAEETIPLRAKVTEKDNHVYGIRISPTGKAVINEICDLDLNEYEEILHKGDFTPGMHIPGGGGMTVEKAYASWQEALEFFPKYLNKTPKAISCLSWIFNSSFERELPDSNLAKLMRVVYLFPECSYGRDGAFFIFGRSDGDFSVYPQDNSVRKAFHRIVDAGELLKSGGMFILPQEIREHNGNRYRREEKCTN